MSKARKWVLATNQCYIASAIEAAGASANVSYKLGSKNRPVTYQ